jgi:hypothetical protein
MVRDGRKPPIRGVRMRVCLKNQEIFWAIGFCQNCYCSADSSRGRQPRQAGFAAINYGHLATEQAA